MSEKKKTKKIQLPKRKKIDIQPFDTTPTSEAAGKSLEEFMKEYKRKQWFENPQSPRA